MKNKPALLGAAFLMATSAIGPGFLTQTSQFTSDLGPSFGFVIFISLLLDLGVQVNIWRIICVSGRPAQDIANRLLPGMGWILALLIGFGGLAFNTGNIAGCGLGLNALTGMDPQMGGVISALFALFIFWYKEAGLLIDTLVKWLGLLMILFTAYIAVSSQPPLAEALYRSVVPEKIDLFRIVTLVGGTVGGYISFSGAHRLLDSGVKGQGAISLVNRSAASGILITTIMRVVLFLAVLGVVMKGVQLNAANPAGSVFQSAAGNLGYRFFGFVMWAAAITSVIGASYTSISFFRSLHPFIDRHYRILVTLFIISSTAIFLFIGKPKTLLITAGALNGMILPVALAILLIAVRRRSIAGEYKHPLWMQTAGWIVVMVMGWMAFMVIKGIGS
jgi:Mn2+/Fe2+ NRAMP family transporter